MVSLRARWQHREGPRGTAFPFCSARGLALRITRTSGARGVPTVLRRMEFRLRFFMKVVLREAKDSYGRAYLKISLLCLSSPLSQVSCGTGLRRKLISVSWL